MIKKQNKLNQYELVVFDEPTDLIDEWGLHLTKIKIPRQSGYEILVTFEEVVLGKSFSVISASKKSCKMKYLIKDKIIPQRIVDQYVDEDDLRAEILTELGRF